MAEHVACFVADLNPGRALRADLTRVDGSEIAVAIVRDADGDFYAIGDTCTHGEVSLSEGDILACEIECWAHGGRFDFRTGTATGFPAIDPVPAFPVRVEGEHVLVDIDAPMTPKENA